MAHDDEEIGRREAMVATAAALAAWAGIPGCASESLPERKKPMQPGTPNRMPVAFLPHGGGPWPFVDLGFPKDELAALGSYLESVALLPKAKPKALLVISAHWEERVPTVTTSPAPPMLYDYYGFPPESYTVKWPAPGQPALAERVQALLGAFGIQSAADPARGYDHGTFVPMMLTYPDARIPTVQLSLKTGLDPREHLAIGRALAPLRQEGVFILGSGMSFHNLRALRDPGGAGSHARAFDDWLQSTGTAPAPERDRRLIAWSEAPSARYAHPREEHLLPLMVIAGAAGDDVGSVSYRGQMFGLPFSAYHFG